MSSEMFQHVTRFDLFILSCFEKWVTHPIERTLGMTNFFLAQAVVALYAAATVVFALISPTSSPLNIVLSGIGFCGLLWISSVLLKRVEQNVYAAQRAKCVNPMKTNVAMVFARYMWLTMVTLSIPLFVHRDQPENLFAVISWFLLTLLVSCDPLTHGESRLKKLLARLRFRARTNASRA